MESKSKIYLVIMVISLTAMITVSLFIYNAFYSSSKQITMVTETQEPLAADESAKTGTLSYDIDKVKSGPDDSATRTISTEEGAPNGQIDEERLKRAEMNRKIFIEGLDKQIVDAKTKLAQNPDDQQAKGMLKMAEMMKESVIKHGSMKREALKSE